MVKKKGKSDTMKYMNKKYGPSTIKHLSDAPDKMDRISTGSIFIDEISDGGYPQGGITEIFGSTSTGKTTLAIQACLEAQKKYKDKDILYVDTEQSMNVHYAKGLGLDLKRCIFTQPTYAEEALDIIQEYVQSGEVSLIVLDSIANLSPKKEYEADMETSTVGLRARILSLFCRKIAPILKIHNVALVCINQERANISIVYGDPNQSTGGKAIPYHSLLRLKLRRVSWIKKNEETKGITAKVEAVKNKTGTAYRNCMIDLLSGKGVQPEAEILSMGRKLGIVVVSGAFFKYNEEIIGQGLDKSINKLKEDKKLCETIIKDINKIRDNNDNVV